MIAFLVCAPVNDTRFFSNPIKNNTVMAVIKKLRIDEKKRADKPQLEYDENYLIRVNIFEI